jgi:hypothetical protein
VKFIQAHQMAKKTWRNGPRTDAACPSAMPWLNWTTTLATATTNVRSNSSSSDVDARCGSSTDRERIGILSAGTLMVTTPCDGSGDARSERGPATSTACDVTVVTLDPCHAEPETPVLTDDAGHPGRAPTPRSTS